MREIKFRAWDETTKKMVLPSVNMHIDSHNGSAWWQFGYDELKPIAGVGQVMQFTGLKDKNGKEIYEGDFVRHDNAGTFEVKWLNVGWTPFMSWHAGELYEVIGNTYENPELLK